MPMAAVGTAVWGHAMSVPERCLQRRPDRLSLGEIIFLAFHATP